MFRRRRMRRRVLRRGRMSRRGRAFGRMRRRLWRVLHRRTSGRFRMRGGKIRARRLCRVRRFYRMRRRLRRMLRRGMSTRFGMRGLGPPDAQARRRERVRLDAAPIAADEPPVRDVALRRRDGLHSDEPHPDALHSARAAPGLGAPGCSPPAAARAGTTPAPLNSPGRAVAAIVGWPPLALAESSGLCAASVKCRVCTGVAATWCSCSACTCAGVGWALTPPVPPT